MPTTPLALAPGLITAQAVFQGTSNLPEDRYVNTFHFRYVNDTTTGVTTAGEAEIVARLTDFYNNNYTTYGIHTFLSNLILRGSGQAEFRLYDQGQEQPREPHVTTWTLGAIDSGGRLPQEAAVCASFYGSRSVPRERGRVYLGPLEIGALDAATARPTTLFRQIIADAMEDLAGNGTLMDWVTLHRTTTVVETNSVTGGWVDNEFDTQRRRGLESTSRIIWP